MGCIVGIYTENMDLGLFRWVVVKAGSFHTPARGRLHGCILSLMGVVGELYERLIT